MKFLQKLIRDRGHHGPLAYHDPRWRRDKGPLLDYLGAVVDHVEAFSRGGAHEESNFVTACNKCNGRKSSKEAAKFRAALRSRPVKGKYGEPADWDGLATVFTVLAQGDKDLTTSEKGWMKALRADK